MEKRGFIISIVLILAIAMFAGNVNKWQSVGKLVYNTGQSTGRGQAGGNPIGGGDSSGACGCPMEDATTGCPDEGVCSYHKCAKEYVEEVLGQDGQFHDVGVIKFADCYEKLTFNQYGNMQHPCGGCMVPQYPGESFTSNCPGSAYVCESINCEVLLSGDIYNGKCSVSI